MHLFIVDETNREPSKNHFFIVGGLVFTEKQISAVDCAVQARREGAGYKPGDNFKFNTNERPKYVSPDQHREAKRLLIADLNEIGVRMIVSLVLEQICRNKSHGERMEYNLNMLALRYHDLLTAEDAYGLFLMDRDNDRFDYLEQRYQHGLDMSYNNTKHILRDRIRLFGMTNDNASNLSSASDICLGAFRYCVNAAVGAGREDVARVMFPDIARLMWSRDGAVDGKRQIGGFGFNPSPRTSNISQRRYKERYETLSEALTQFSTGPLVENMNKP